MGLCTSKTDSTPEQQRQWDQTWSPKPAIPGSGEAGCNLEEEEEEEEAVAPRASLMFVNSSMCTIRVSVYTEAGKVLVRDFQMEPWGSHSSNPLLENEEVSFPADHEEVRVCLFYLNARGYQLFMNDVYSIVGKKARAERMVFTIKLTTSDVEARIKTKGGHLIRYDSDDARCSGPPAPPSPYRRHPLHVEPNPEYDRGHAVYIP